MASHATTLAKIRRAPESVDEVTELQPLAIRDLRAIGYEVSHVSRAVKQVGRFLDLWVRGRGRACWVELKRERGKLSAWQAQEVQRIRAAGGEVYIVRPSIYERWLAGMAGRRAA